MKGRGELTTSLDTAVTTGLVSYLRAVALSFGSKRKASKKVLTTFVVMVLSSLPVILKTPVAMPAFKHSTSSLSTRSSTLAANSLTLS